MGEAMQFRRGARLPTVHFPVRYFGIPLTVPFEPFVLNVNVEASASLLVQLEGLDDLERGSSCAASMGGCVVVGSALGWQQQR